MSKMPQMRTLCLIYSGLFSPLGKVLNILYLNNLLGNKLNPVKNYCPVPLLSEGGAPRLRTSPRHGFELQLHTIDSIGKSVYMHMPPCTHLDILANDRAHNDGGPRRFHCLAML